MKITLTLCLALACAASAQAEMFGSRGARGETSVGAHRHHDHGARTRVHFGFGHDRFHWRNWDHGHHWRGYHGDFLYRAYPAYSYYPGYTVEYPYYGSTGYYRTAPASGAANGLLLGALAGGIVGHNSGSLGHNGWRGAAWGAGLGWLLGSVADANRRAETYSAAQAPAIVTPPAPATADVPAHSATAQPAPPVTIINNYYNNAATPMSGANGLFGR